MEPNPPTLQTAVTQILHEVRAGGEGATDRLLPLVYEELRRLARGYMKNEQPGQTIQATALVHEAYVRLVGGQDFSWDHRGHFFAAAALAMRRILVERARHRNRIKRGGDRKRVELDDFAAFTETPGTDLVALDEALDRLAAYDRRKCDVVMLKYFAGLTNEEIAAALDVSPATVRNDWTFARAWLLRTLRERETQGGDDAP